MKTFFIVIGFLLLADALFAWANMERMQPAVKRLFPKLNFTLLMVIEGVGGAGILLSQLLV